MIQEKSIFYGNFLMDVNVVMPYGIKNIGMTFFTDVV